MFKKDKPDPQELATALKNYLNCPCEYFAPMSDITPVFDAWTEAGMQSQSEGFVPVVVAVDDTLLDFLIWRTQKDRPTNFSDFDANAVNAYRQEILASPVEDAEAMFAERTKEGMEFLEGEEMSGGGIMSPFAGLHDYGTHMTMPLLLAKIPVQHPWEVFAYLPFGGWNACPDTPQLMSAAKYWFEKYGAVPSVITHDILEFSLPSPVPREEAMILALEQCIFCQDIIDGAEEDNALGSLADSLSQSCNWFFWWD